MQYGYARVSSSEQETALQLDAFKRAGVTNITHEKRRARSKRRPVLDALLANLRPGDELVFWKVDRVARSIRDLSQMLEHCVAVGANFRSLTEPFDTRTPAGRMMVQLLGIVAEFEWHMIRERSMAGQLAAVERGVKLGRKRALTPEQEIRVYKALNRGRSMAELGRQYGVHLSSIKRIKLRIEKPESPAVARRFA